MAWRRGSTASKRLRLTSLRLEPGAVLIRRNISIHRCALSRPVRAGFEFGEQPLQAPGIVRSAEIGFAEIRPGLGHRPFQSLLKRLQLARRQKQGGLLLLFDARGFARKLEQNGAGLQTRNQTF